MDPSGSRPQEQAGLPPEKAFWKALAVVSITSIVIWTLLWILVGWQAGFQGDEWMGSIFVAFTILVLTPVVYASYRTRPTRRKSSRRASMLIAICYTVLGVARIVVYLSQRRAHGNQWVELVFAFAWCLIAALYFYRAFQAKDPAPLSS